MTPAGVPPTGLWLGTAFPDRVLAVARSIPHLVASQTTFARDCPLSPFIEVCVAVLATYIHTRQATELEPLSRRKSTPRSAKNSRHSTNRRDRT